MTQSDHPLVNLAARVMDKLETIPMDVMLIVFRIAPAVVFFKSGLIKWGDFQAGFATTILLFEEEYQVPLLPPVLSAHLALFAELALPVLLVLGLAGRGAAAGLIFMTLTIQIFVYPLSYADHLMWFACLLPVLAKGPGKYSLDHFVRNKFLGA